MQPKQKPTNSEALLLIRTKRDRAKAAMDIIVKRYAVLAYKPEPGLDVLLEYLSNMVYALELLLKVMADDWESHKVGKMYETVFGRPYTDPILMQVLERAIKNQKFIYEPADRLLDHVPEIEALWDELTTEFYNRSWMEDTSVQREVIAPPGFIKFLRANIRRFYRAEPYVRQPVMQREHQMQLLEHQIRALQDELESLRAGTTVPEETGDEIAERLHREHQQNIDSAGNMFDMNLQMRNQTLSFGTWQFGKVLSGFLG